MMYLYTHMHANWIGVNYAVQCWWKFMSVNDNNVNNVLLD